MIAWRSALEQVFHLQQFPDALESLRQQRLPDGMASLIRLASDSGGLLQDVAQTVELDAELIQLHVSKYLLSVCLYPGSHPVRLLCLNDANNLVLAKEHHRLLLKWLHPDKNAQNIAYAERVNQAWTCLKNQEYTAEQALILNNPPQYGHTQLPSPKSRFPLFLAVAFALAGVLLALSFWPNEQVYIYAVNNSVQNNNELDASNAQLDLDRVLLSRFKKPITEVKAALPIKSSSSLTKPAITKTSINIPVAIQKNITTNSAIAEQKEQTSTITQPAVIALQDDQTEEQAEHIQPVQPQVLAKETVITETTKPSSSAIRSDQGQRLVNEFARTYKIGNLQQFMFLFSTMARNDHGDRSALEQDYRYLFTQSTRREIQFSNLQWHDTGKFSLTAHYNTKVKWPNRIWLSRNSGSIEFYFIQENGKVRIQQILIGE